MKLLVLNEVSFEQLRNILVMYFTFSVLKLFKDNDVRLEQPLNISFMLVTFPVSKLLKSTDVRAEQFLNILAISVTLLVLKFFRALALVRLLHPENNANIVVTLDVFKYIVLDNVVNFEQLTNHALMLVGCTLSKLLSNTTLVNLPETVLVHWGA